MTDNNEKDKTYNPEDYPSYKDWANVIPMPSLQMRNPFPREEDYVPYSISQLMAQQTADFSDLQAVNKEIDELRIAMFNVDDHLRKAEQKLAVSKAEYDMAYNRAYMMTDDVKTDSQRKIISEIKCESQKSKLIVREEIVRDLKSRVRLFANEMNALQTLSYNMRKEIQ